MPGKKIPLIPLFFIIPRLCSIFTHHRMGGSLHGQRPARVKSYHGRQRAGRGPFNGRRERKATELAPQVLRGVPL